MATRMTSAKLSLKKVLGDLPCTKLLHIISALLLGAYVAVSFYFADVHETSKEVLETLEDVTGQMQFAVGPWIRYISTIVLIIYASSFVLFWTANEKWHFVLVVMCFICQLGLLSAIFALAAICFDRCEDFAVYGILSSLLFPTSILFTAATLVCEWRESDKIHTCWCGCLMATQSALPASSQVVDVEQQGVAMRRYTPEINRPSNEHKRSTTSTLATEISNPAPGTLFRRGGPVDDILTL